MSVNYTLKSMQIIGQRQTFYKQRVIECSFAKKETVDIDILVKSRNGDRKIMQLVKSCKPILYLFYYFFSFFFFHEGRTMSTTVICFILMKIFVYSKLVQDSSLFSTKSGWALNYCYIFFSELFHKISQFFMYQSRVP